MFSEAKIYNGRDREVIEAVGKPQRSCINIALGKIDTVDNRNSSWADSRSRPIFRPRNLIKYLLIFSTWGYYTLLIPYRIKFTDGKYVVHTYFPQKILCSILHLLSLSGYVIMGVVNLLIRKTTLSEDPMSLFCILRGVMPPVCMIIYLKTVWRTEKGLKHFLKESIDLADNSNNSALSWSQTLIVYTILVLMMAPVLGFHLVMVLTETDFRTRTSVLFAIFGYVLYSNFIACIASYGVTMFAGFLVGTIGQDVASSLKQVGYVQLHHIREFYEGISVFMDTMNDALSSLVATSVATMSLFVGYFLFSVLDDPSFWSKIIFVGPLVCGMLGLIGAAHGHDLMNGSIRKLLQRTNYVVDTPQGLAELMKLEGRMRDEPLGLYAGKFPFTYGLLLAVLSTFLTYFLVMLQLVGKPSGCQAQMSFLAVFEGINSTLADKQGLGS